MSELQILGTPRGLPTGVSFGKPEPDSAARELLLFGRVFLFSCYVTTPRACRARQETELALSRRAAEARAWRTPARPSQCGGWRGGGRLESGSSGKQERKTGRAGESTNPAFKGAVGLAVK